LSRAAYPMPVTLGRYRRSRALREGRSRWSAGEFRHGRERHNGDWKTLAVAANPLAGDTERWSMRGLREV